MGIVAIWQQIKKLLNPPLSQFFSISHCYYSTFKEYIVSKKHFLTLFSKCAQHRVNKRLNCNSKCDWIRMLCLGCRFTVRSSVYYTITNSEVNTNPNRLLGLAIYSLMAIRLRLMYINGRNKAMVTYVFLKRFQSHEFHVGTKFWTHGRKMRAHTIRKYFVHSPTFKKLEARPFHPDLNLQNSGESRARWE
jgi:hypothetical protein